MEKVGRVRLTNHVLNVMIVWTGWRRSFLANILGALGRKKAENQITAANSEEDEGSTGRLRGNTSTSSRATKAREWHWLRSLRKSQEKVHQASSTITLQFLASTKSLQHRRTRLTNLWITCLWTQSYTVKCWTSSTGTLPSTASVTSIPRTEVRPKVRQGWATSTVTRDKFDEKWSKSKILLYIYYNFRNARKSSSKRVQKYKLSVLIKLH